VVGGRKDVQERVGKEEGEGEDHEEAERGVDEGHVKGTAVGRGVVHEEGDVGVDEQEDEDAEEDGGEEEHAEDLWGGVRRTRAHRGRRTHATAQSAMVQFASTRERPTALTRAFCVRRECGARRDARDRPWCRGSWKRRAGDSSRPGRGRRG
jgi:hypothetical protein